jgi:hypothetical protein
VKKADMEELATGLELSAQAMETQAAALRSVASFLRRELKQKGKK